MKKLSATRRQSKKRKKAENCAFECMMDKMKFLFSLQLWRQACIEEKIGKEENGKDDLAHFE